jgi:hypothetical protein
MRYSIIFNKEWLQRDLKWKRKELKKSLKKVLRQLIFKELEKARNAIKKNNDEGAKLFLQMAASK